MSEYTVVLPSLGDDAGDSAKVSFVYVNVGGTISENDDLIEMVTDKATFNVPAPKTGKVVKILVNEDDEIKVGAPICVLEIT